MDITSQPLERKCASSAGRSWRIFAAIAVFSSIRHHTWPSIGPGLMEGRMAAGINTSIDFNRAEDSVASAVRFANVGES